MPDPILMLSAMAVAGMASAVILWICGWPWRAARPTWVKTGWVLGVGVGSVLGCWLLGMWPHWPLRQDQDRLLGLVFPALMVIELLACYPGVPCWQIRLLRFTVVAGCAPVLLFGTTYLPDLVVSGSPEWSPARAWSILGGMAVALAGVWALLGRLARRAPGPSHQLYLAGTIAGAAVTVMLSGYASGGQIGLPLAAALLGGSVAAIVLPQPSRGIGPVGVAVVGLFSLLVIGHFFGHLTTAHAILLMLAPLLGWLPELPYLRRLPSWARGLARVIVVGALVSAVVVHAQRKFVEDFRSPSGSPPKEPSIQDYMDFGR
jgi:hypothetical protein